MNKMSIPKLIFSIAICQAAGIVGSLFTAPAIPGWYAKLDKPVFNPPNWIFGPVWIILYLLIGIALYLILVDKNKNKKIALWLFGIQLVLNSVWSIIFFGLQNPFYALIELVILWIAVLLTIWQFWKINAKAGALLLPYIAWGTFAMVLNYSIWQLNF
ncbi:tryptophan-rich sensory protein [Candidatus Peregrinibacteria bacterium]|nr:tryptophan-rich sensory protein [Candidatus Peregrinibacteria bacterium]